MRRKNRLFIRRVAALMSVATAAWVGASIAPARAPSPVAPFRTLFVDALPPSPATTTTTTTTAVVLPQGFCPDVTATAFALGWRYDDLDELDYVVWRESRCLSHVFYRKDPNGGSRGLTQINGYWCQPSRYSDYGWLQDQRLLSSCDDLYNPIVNLLAAQAIFNYSAANNGNGWGPWAMPQDFCGSSTLGALCHLGWGGKGGQ